MNLKSLWELNGAWLFEKSCIRSALAENILIGDLWCGSKICRTSLCSLYMYGIIYLHCQVVMGTYPGLKPPMISGIDLVGTIDSTTSTKFKVHIIRNCKKGLLLVIYFILQKLRLVKKY